MFNSFNETVSVRYEIKGLVFSVPNVHASQVFVILSSRRLLCKIDYDNDSSLEFLSLGIDSEVPADDVT